MSDFLYPFIERDERDVGSLLEDLTGSARAKATVSTALRHATIAASGADLEATASAMAARFAEGGRLFTFGNGGSSTDAAGVATLFSRPPWGRALPARSLVADQAVLTALANDVGFEQVFSRQLNDAAGPADIALGLSTSGSSRNLLRAFAESRRLGALGVGLAGYDGGSMAADAELDHCLVVGSESVHRIQEVQNAVVFELWERVQRHLREGVVHGQPAT